MTLGRCVVLVPPEGGSYAFGGDRFRRIAEAILAPHVEARHAGWTVGSAPSQHEAWDDILRGAHALVLPPWLSLVDPATFEGFRLDAAPDLKVIAGTFDFRLEWIDLDEAASRSIVVIDTSRSMTPTVAEFGVAITLALLRDIPAAIEVVRGGGWIEAPMQGGPVFGDLSGCRVGLAGYGSINRHYRRFVRPFGCEVQIFDPFVSEDVAESDDVQVAGSLVELARRSDVFVVAIPATPTTLGVVDARVIDSLAPGSLFVLLSRMAVVEQDALWRRLRGGELRAALDVFEPEPPPGDAWFRRAPNVLPTPHIAGDTAFAHERCFREACADALRVLIGEPPRHAATVRDKGIYDGSLAVTVQRDPAVQG